MKFETPQMLTRPHQRDLIQRRFLYCPLIMIPHRRVAGNYQIFIEKTRQVQCGVVICAFCKMVKVLSLFRSNQQHREPLGISLLYQSISASKVCP